MDAERTFTVDEARALMPAVQERAGELIAIRADLAELTLDLQLGADSPLGGIPEAKALEARMDEVLGWFTSSGIEIKGLAPILVDFPSVVDGVSVRLCWVEGESALAWYHRSEIGFPGRRRLP